MPIYENQTRRVILNELCLLTLIRQKYKRYTLQKVLMKFRQHQGTQFSVYSTTE